MTEGPEALRLAVLRNAGAGRIWRSCLHRACLVRLPALLEEPRSGAADVDGSHVNVYNDPEAEGAHGERLGGRGPRTEPGTWMRYTTGAIPSHPPPVKQPIM